ncbi:protein prenylyltransferase [Gonapodya prolifera JEL478]|uniref:Geranylgeranyl transferase type-2 subunit alpha n=1 Tax=Gonapodya prolifera (strain JEL478) TaxID=1344416 RepID=A0A139A2Q0_GONPJ|nr:protein prenylyltransferase [Gonapodya prolifera JEL478]|eukprot:KXS11014.1 protein prenylyltransferase [Gonapodya prolifera JEL478]
MEHGRKKEQKEVDPKILEAKKEREQKRIEEYRQLLRDVRHKRAAQERDDAALALTRSILTINPEAYDVWNFRRVILIEQFGQLPPDEVQTRCKAELRLLDELLKVFPKSYWLWNHRQWVLQTLPHPEKEIARDLALVAAMLNLDARNFHGWDYRRYLIAFRDPAIPNGISTPKTEFDYTTKKIDQNFSNYSAWHYRSTVLNKAFASGGLEEQLEKDFELVRSAIYTEPADQSAWLYQRWLLGRQQSNVLSCLGGFLVGPPSLDGETGILVVFSAAVDVVAPPVVCLNTTALVGVSMRPVSPAHLQERTPAESTTTTTTSSQFWFLGFPNDATLVSGNSRTIHVRSLHEAFQAPSGLRLHRTVDLELDVEGDLSRFVVPFTGEYVDADHVMRAFRVSQGSEVVSDHESRTTHVNQWAPQPVSRDILLREIESLRELIEIEPDSKWPLLTLVYLLDRLGGDDLKEREEILDRLSHLDRKREIFYQDLKSRRRFDKIVSSILKG